MIHDQAVKRPLKLRLTPLFSLLIPFCLLVLYWGKYIRTGYFPTGDEFSILVHSASQFHPAFSSWFLEGYSHYFTVYPAWTVPYSDFLRPVANLCYYLNSLIFNSHWSYYLLLTYAVQSGIVAVTMNIAIKQLHVSHVYAVCVGVLCFISPAFGIEELYFPSFAFDLLASLLVLVGLNQILKGKLISAWLCFTIAIFTKETAIFAPFIAAMIVYANGSRGLTRSRKWRESGLFLLPVLAWLLLRHIAFPTVGGVYVFSDFSLHKQLITLLHGTLCWPMGMMRNPIGTPMFKYVFSAINFSFWILIILGIVKSVRAIPSKTFYSSISVVMIADQFGIQSRERIIVLVFCIGSLGMPIILDLQQRFGASFYPLLFLVLACIFQSASYKSFRIGALSVCVLIVATTLYQRIASNSGLRNLQTQWAMSADYVKSISRTRAKTVFTVDDVSGEFSSPESIKRFASYFGTIVRVNDIIPFSFSKCADQLRVSIHHLGPTSVLISSGPISSCGVYAFDGADARVIAFPMDRVIRNTSSGRFLVTQPDRSGPISIQIDNVPANSVILIPEMKQRRYRELQLDSQPGAQLAFALNSPKVIPQ